jgi:carboxyl-terminal processing protease
MNNHVHPSTDERKAIVTAAADLFRSRFYSPDLDGFDLDQTLAERMPELLSTSTFPSALRDVFAGSGAQPIDVYHESHKQIPLSRFLKATLFQRSADDLVFRDVLVGGRAREVKIQSGDRLLKVNGIVPDSEGFRINAHLGLELIVEGKSGFSRKLSFGVPSSYKAKPEQNVEFKKLNDDVGHIRIASWPGILGIEVARETDAAIRALKCKRLVVDLRGNFGSAGAGNLRLMSYLTPERIPVGYSLTRRRAEDGYDRESLPRFESIPRLKLLGLPILWRFRKLDKSIVVLTEGHGRQ